jgi:eukaryotic-like serine/threonine-protein kinase
MNSRWQKIEEAVVVASEMEIEKRAAWIAEFCDGDVEIQSEIESLLGVQSEAENFLEKMYGVRIAKILPENESDFSGKQFGSYKIIRQIGRGGMGAVYLATRADQEFNIAARHGHRRHFAPIPAGTPDSRRARTPVYSEVA